MAIPEKEDDGISFAAGKKIGLRIGYSEVGEKEDAYATTFDKWSYVYFPLGTGKVEPGGRAETTQLKGSSPNPFRQSTTIRFQLKERQKVSLAVYDVLGRRIETLVNQEMRPGRNLKVEWTGEDASGRSVASGVYFVRLQTASGTQDTRKVVLVK
jgi:hypothetical protein